MDLAAQLRELRTRAGDPSFRDLERLIAHQGRKRPMARSTIQEKLAGRSALNLTQVLSIVEAVGEYARINNAPLPPREIDQTLWRERLAKPAERIATTKTPKLPKIPNHEQKIDWDTKPLIEAEMFDLVEVFENSAGKPVATWLPEVLRELVMAEMDISTYLVSAASDRPQGVVQTVAALDEEFPRGQSGGWGNPDEWKNQQNELTVGALLRCAAHWQGVTSSPAIVTGLRRAQVGSYVNDYLESIAMWHASSNIESIVEHLRSAALPKDANRILGYVGSSRQTSRLLDVVKYFQEKGKTEDRNRILKGVASENMYHPHSVIIEFHEESTSNEILIEIARGIPYGKHSEWSTKFREAGLERFANLVMKVAEEPPF
ncbi:hypothetical protein [Streptomyces sp. NPDC093970]|uniref:hypothetical protein n=1 Tax=Streptomyces sp. NPDC093970 TaxID=3155076 RepID=UPI00343B3F4B